MKKLLTLFVLAVFAYTVQAQGVSENRTAPETLQLSENNFDFGKIQQGRPVTHNFTITNKGDKPLILDNVMASCGCTTPEWSREPIQPGKSATLKVGYNAAAEGAFNRSVTIMYNDGQVKSIVISGTVFKSPATSAPLNASLSLLKQKNH